MEMGAAAVQVATRFTVARECGLPSDVKQKVTELARAWTADQAKKQAAKGNMWMQKVQDSYWAFFDKYSKYGDYRVQ